ncbi:helix-turn-helix domain-containing protein [Caballeronia temeraria]|uniref:helix-turn-helix domain-containing protein n=1 Tax=Caballeronia temeraria TaxID=1777137 RepID=UPI0009EEF787|nr:helix-turn-helix transcriptional regulator [Caballeronia temeraria]
MKSTVQYLDEVREKLELPSDYAAAKALGVTRAAVSSWRVGRSAPDELTCARIAEALGIEPIEVIAASQFERSKDEHARAVWESIWGKAAGVIAKASIVCAVGLSAAVTPTSQAQASGNTGTTGEGGHSARIYVMSNK